ncbi:MAG: twin-arginine translocase subunit TatC [Prevotellaceae bacterium]|jgi:sec-independent protein translocase protein TatC|nr:twin-arginine translocase subunit TatC [Prevotellaceae bacterium]
MSAEVKRESTFWEHLDELRKILFRIIIVVVAVMIVAFLCKGTLFGIILAPSKPDFIVYRLFCHLADRLALPDICPETFHVELINTQLASQFIIHLSAAFYAGVLLTLPYIIYQIFRFVSPALYANERKYSGRVICFAVLLFLMGVLLNYFIIFPLSFRFLATYQVEESVINMISLSSYMDTLLLLSLMLGIMAELPIVSWLFAKLGFLTDSFMRKYRKHAIIIILIVAAIITPTADAFTLMLVFVPIYILYELSILVVKKVCRKKATEIAQQEADWENPYFS